MVLTTKFYVKWFRWSKLANENQPKYIVLDIETQGLLPWYGDKITCICAKASTGPDFKLTNSDDIALIQAFLQWILRTNRTAAHALVTYNGKGFDIPFILARLAMETDINKESGLFILQYPHIDLFEEVQKLTNKRMSLDTVAKLYGCTPKSGSGKNAIKLAENGKYGDLMEYCYQDVLTTLDVYLKLKNRLSPSVCEISETANMPGMIY